MSSTGEHVGRAYLEEEVEQRWHHETAEAVRTTCSLARAERLLGGEYYGRFLIELLQNAADAWRNDERSTGSKSRVAITLTEEPALVVANQGTALSAEVVVKALGHIGASTKSEGEAIGHKGIGFKSVLELTSKPEIYSGLSPAGSPALAVAFDPQRALEELESRNPKWHQFVGETDGLDPGDPLAAIPVLRFPRWIEDADVPRHVSELAADGFDTVVRLPFDAGLASRNGTDRETWLGAVRRALSEDVSDQVLLLLGTFSEVVVHNRHDGLEPVVIRPRAHSDSHELQSELKPEVVTIERTGARSSHWLVYRRTMAGGVDLAGEIALGLRYEPTADGNYLVAALDGHSSAPFHLFFPTRIASGTPFLLHGYFKVDASRKGFYGPEIEGNRRILSKLAELARDVVSNVAATERVDAASIVNLVASSAEPEDDLARSFRHELLSLLDNEKWVPVLPAEGEDCLSTPNATLADSPKMTSMVREVFPPDYVLNRVGLYLPVHALSDQATMFIRDRVGESRETWRVLEGLCLPGDIDIWPEDEADPAFLLLIDLMNWLRAEAADETDKLLLGLRGNPKARLVPVVARRGGRSLVPLPDPSEGIAGRRSSLVMARVKGSASDPLVPPDVFDVSFLADGLLTSEQAVDAARPLGVRSFTVDNVLDRLSGNGDAVEGAREVLDFLWRLLSRERRSQYGTRKVAARARTFEPADWFWCQPGRAREGGSRRQEQQRERYLANVLLPTRARGVWKPAGELAFGADWADWLEGPSGYSSNSDRVRRAESYRALEATHPSDEALLAGPAEVFAMLPQDDVALGGDLDEGDDDSEEFEYELSPSDWDLHRHAFLLRLGVWEVLPLRAFESRERRDRPQNFPWHDQLTEKQMALCKDDGAWRFGLDGWQGTEHTNVYLAEDYRFQWNLAEAALRSAESVAALLVAGSRLYGERLHAAMFCQACGSHRTMRESNRSDDYPSLLALELQEIPWVPVSVAGALSDEPVVPSSAWWLNKAPERQGLLTSPWRFLPICSPETGVTEDLKRLARVTTLDSAGPEELLAALRRLRAAFDSGAISLERSTDRRSFISLHTLLYERLAVDVSTESRAALESLGVLCTVGNVLTFESLEAARHDDGTFASFVRHFVDRVPLSVLPRDKSKSAKALGIEPLVVRLEREGEDEGVDVTQDLSNILAMRVPQLLAIRTFYSAAGLPLTLEGEEFANNARRLSRLTVRKVDELVIRASVEGTEHAIELGRRESNDIFLDQASSRGGAVLYHDFDGVGWEERLRRKIAPHLASLIEANSYAHSFALFMQCDSDSERDEFLLELGIGDDDVASVANQLGAVDAGRQARQRSWYQAVLRVLGSPIVPESLEHDRLVTQFVDAGLAHGVAEVLVAHGGGDDARSDTGPGSSLRTLRDSGTDLAALHDALQSLDSQDGLRVMHSRQLFAEWKRANERRLAAALGTSIEPDRAKAIARNCVMPPHGEFDIDAELPDLLSEVAALLDPSQPDLAFSLATDPLGTLAAVGRFSSPSALDEAVGVIYDAVERQRAQSASAATWKKHLRALALFVRVTATDRVAQVRNYDDEIGRDLRLDTSDLSDLVDPARTLLQRNKLLRDRFVAEMGTRPPWLAPSESEIQNWAIGAGIDRRVMSLCAQALSMPRNSRAARLRARAQQLDDAAVTAFVPAGLTMTPAGAKTSVVRDAAGAAPSNTIAVRKIKVSSGVDQRKKELGDDGEQWALADAVRALLALDDEARADAIDDVRRVLGNFDDAATRDLLEHASEAAAPRQDGDEDELTSALEGLLHASRVSDGFGFDVIGWASPAHGVRPQAICMEVKSTFGDLFHLSANEWRVARELRDRGEGNRFAVLAVRRAKSGSAPERMDLLVDPVSLEEEHRLQLEEDGYVAHYHVE